jgi:excinuclease UvrABC nuclease subunit
MRINIIKNIKWDKVIPPDFDEIPEEAGIYVISTLQTLDDKYEVKYVGQTNDLQARAKKHWSENEENEDLKAHIKKRNKMKFSYSEVSLAENRDGMELYLYNTYDPVYNINKPPGKTVIACTLPKVRKHK